jgi:hypothetical protein
MREKSDQENTISNKVDYVRALQGKHGEDLQALTNKTMQLRFKEDQHKWHKYRENLKLSTKNFASIILRCRSDDGQKIEIISTDKSNPEQTGNLSAGQTDKIKNLAGHTERIVLSQAINNAIDKGWKPKDENNSLLSKFEAIPPSVEELKKYKEALQDVEIILFNEISFCTIPPKVYTLCLWSDLPNQNPAQAKPKNVYIYEDGQYIVRDSIKSDLCKGTIDPNKVDLTCLSEQISDKNFKSVVMETIFQQGKIPFKEGEDINCTELFTEILSGKGHLIHHAINFGDNPQAKNAARIQGMIEYCAIQSSLDICAQKSIAAKANYPTKEEKIASQEATMKAKAEGSPEGSEEDQHKGKRYKCNNASQGFRNLLKTDTGKNITTSILQDPNTVVTNISGQQQLGFIIGNMGGDWGGESVVLI